VSFLSRYFRYGSALFWERKKTKQQITTMMADHRRDERGDDDDNDRDTTGSLGEDTVQTKSSTTIISSSSLLQEKKANNRGDNNNHNKKEPQPAAAQKKKPPPPPSILASFVQKPPPTPQMQQWSIRPYLAPPSDNLLRSYARAAVEDPDSDQSLLTKAAIYSFSDVIFPAVVLQHLRALERLNAVVKRDDRVNAATIKQVRRAFAFAARTTMAKMRQQPPQEQQEPPPTFAKRLLRQRQQQQQAAAQKDQPIDPKELVRLKQAYNQEVWQEIAELIPANIELEKEHAKWEAIKAQLAEKLERLKAAKAKEDEEEAAAVAMETDEGEEEEAADDDSTTATKTKQDKLLEKIHDTITWLRVSAVRLKEGLPDAKRVVAATERHRTNLYESYRAASTMDCENDQASPPASLLDQLATQAFGDDDDGDQSMETL
jgi:hypothetical protein